MGRNQQRKQVAAATGYARGSHGGNQQHQQTLDPSQRFDSSDSINDVCAGNPMNSCNKIVKDDEEALLCESCHRWFHIQCQNVSRPKYKAIGELGSDISWYCVVCKVSVPKVLDTLSNISNKVEALEEEVENIKDRVSDLETKDTDSMNSLKDNIAKECREAIKHENDRVRRLNNVIIFGLTESTQSTTDERIRDDKERVQTIFTDELGQPDIVPARVIRLFSRVPNPSRKAPIPLKVVLNSQVERSRILQSAKALANPKSPQNKVYISPDLNKEDREANDKLIEELKAKREASRAKGESCNYTIRKRKVVMIPGQNQSQKNSQSASSQ